MKPKGFVFAASITSQISIPIEAYTSFSSFTKACLRYENVLQQLGSFCDPTRGNRDDCLDRQAINLHCLLQTPRRQTTDEFGHLAHFAGRICRVFTFRREGQMKMLTGL